MWTPSNAAASSTTNIAGEQQRSPNGPYLEDKNGRPRSTAAVSSKGATSDRMAVSLPTREAANSTNPTDANKNRESLSPIGTQYSTAKPDAKDILLGRGRPFQNHPGNIIMRRLLDRYKDRYNQVHRDARSDIAMELIDRLLEKGARFLKRRVERNSDGESTAGCTQRWEEASRSEAYDKVCHVLRSGRTAAQVSAAKKPPNSGVKLAERNNRRAALARESPEEQESTSVPWGPLGASSYALPAHAEVHSDGSGMLSQSAAASAGNLGSLFRGTGAFPRFVASERRLQICSPPISLPLAYGNYGMDVLGRRFFVNGAAAPFMFASLGPRDAHPLNPFLRRNLFLNRPDIHSPVVDGDPSMPFVALNDYLERHKWM